MSENQKQPKRHFLFHIFRMDKEAHPMPNKQADSLFLQLKTVFSDAKKKEREST